MKYDQNFKEFVVLEQSSLDVIATKKIYIDMVNDLAAGMLLSQIVYWHLPSQETGRSRLTVFHEGQYWLAKGRHDWHDEIRLSPKQVDRALKILKQFDLVDVMTKKWNGNPTTHFRLKQDNFMTLIKEYQRKLVDDFEVFPDENDVEPYSDMVITERGITKSPKGEERNHPKGNNDITQRGRTLTKSTSEITSEITTNNKKLPLLCGDETPLDNAPVANHKIPYAAIMDYLNQQTEKIYSSKAAINRELIRGRFRDGYTESDFYRVIDNKVREWKHSPKMEKYLRPTTLFSKKKFDIYANEGEKHGESGSDLTKYDLGKNTGLPDDY